MRMANADIIVEQDFTTVIRNLHLGNGDGETSQLWMYDDDGDVVIRINHRPEIWVSSNGGQTVLRDGQIRTEFIDLTENLTTQEVDARLGRIKDLRVGGRELEEDTNQAGVLTVLNDDGEATVEADGQDGSIRHTGEISRLSDARLKHRIEDVEDALDTVRRLRGVQYEWDAAADGPRLDDDRHLGFIAQEVEQVLPEAVDADTDGRLGTVDEAFTPLLVEAIKEQQSLIESQAARLAALEAHVDTLEAGVEAGRTE